MCHIVSRCILSPGENKEEKGFDAPDNDDTPVPIARVAQLCPGQTNRLLAIGREERVLREFPEHAVKTKGWMQLEKSGLQEGGCSGEGS